MLRPFDGTGPFQTFANELTGLTAVRLSPALQTKPFRLRASTIQSRGAATVKFAAPSKLIRKVLKLPGSIWREDNPVVQCRQSDSRCEPVTICEGLCKFCSIAWIASVAKRRRTPRVPTWLQAIRRPTMIESFDESLASRSDSPDRSSDFAERIYLPVRSYSL